VERKGEEYKVSDRVSGQDEREGGERVDGRESERGRHNTTNKVTTSHRKISIYITFPKSVMARALTSPLSGSAMQTLSSISRGVADT
jgi:hypothetical protein